jgi:hypothetical protein
MLSSVLPNRFCNYYYSRYFNVCSGTNFTTSCPRICFGYIPGRPGICGGRGTCIDVNQCECYTGWTGANCDATTCFGIDSRQPEACSGNGKCTNFNTCICNDGRTGPKCLTMAALTLSTDPKFYIALTVPASFILCCFCCTIMFWIGCCINSAIGNARKSVDEIQYCW